MNREQSRSDERSPSVSLADHDTTPNAESAEIPRLATLGKYRILKELGRGGMEAIYLAHDESSRVR